MPSFFYKSYPKYAFDKLISAENLKIALLSGEHSPNSSHEQWSDVSANEISGTGYTTGGKSVTVSSSTDGTKTAFSVSEISWESATFSTRYGVLYDSITGFLVLLIDFESEKNVDTQTFTISAPSPEPFIS